VTIDYFFFFFFFFLFFFFLTVNTSLGMLAIVKVRLLYLGEPASVWRLAFYTDVFESHVLERIFLPESAFSADSLTVSLQPLCA